MYIIKLILLLVSNAFAGPYYDLSLSVSAGTATEKLAGRMCVSASSQTPNVCTIILEGSNGAVTATSFSGSGASITNLNMNNASAGTLVVARGGTNATSFTAGSLIFAGTSGTSLSQDNSNLFWDSTNDRVGIGTNSPIAALHIQRGLSQPIIALDAASSATDNTYLGLYRDASNLQWQVGLDYSDAVNENFYVKSNPGNNYPLYSKHSGVTGVYTTSPLYPLHITGTTYINGQTIVSGTVTVQGGGTTGSESVFNVLGGTFNVLLSGRVGIGTLTPTVNLDVYNTPGQAVVAAFRNTRTSAIGLASIIDITQISTGSALAMVRFQANDAGGTQQTWSIGNDGSDSSKFKFSYSNSAVFATTKLTLTPAGNVGIGTTDPQVPLDVKGAGGAAGSFSVDRQFASDGNSIRTAATVARSYSGGAGADGIGTQLVFNAETETEGSMAALATISAVATDATAGTIDGDLTLNIVANGSILEFIRLTSTRHIEFSGTAPTVTANCGTSPSIVGNDNRFRLDVGTGGTATTCTVTFNAAWTNAPICSADNESTILLVQPAPTTTTIVLTSATPFTASDKIAVRCDGYR